MEKCTHTFRTHTQTHIAEIERWEKSITASISRRDTTDENYTHKCICMKHYHEYCISVLSHVQQRWDYTLPLHWMKGSEQNLFENKIKPRPAQNVADAELNARARWFCSSSGSSKNQRKKDQWIRHKYKIEYPLERANSPASECHQAKISLCHIVVCVLVIWNNENTMRWCARWYPKDRHRGPHTRRRATMYTLHYRHADDAHILLSMKIKKKLHTTMYDHASVHRKKVQQKITAKMLTIVVLFFFPA